MASQRTRTRTRIRCIATALLAILVSRAGMAQTPAPDELPPAPSPPVVVLPAMLHSAPVPPSHFSFENQMYDASVNGLRSYLETIRTRDAQLYAELDPELQRLERRQRTAIGFLLAGLGVGMASAIYAIVGRGDCQAPSVNDPNFSAQTAAWGACNDANFRKTMTFSLIGMGAAAAGVFAGGAIRPGRSDLLDFVNRQNTLGREPLRLQLGYDPMLRLASAGAALTF